MAKPANIGETCMRAMNVSTNMLFIGFADAHNKSLVNGSRHPQS